MGTFVEPAYIERLQEDIQIACRRLEENGHESVVITLSETGNFITGSKRGKEFVEDRHVFVTDFEHFCIGKKQFPVKTEKQLITAVTAVPTPEPVDTESLINADAPNTDAQNTDAPNTNALNDMFDDDTNDYDTFDDFTSALEHLDEDIGSKTAGSSDTKEEKDGETVKEKDIKVETGTEGTRRSSRRKSGKRDFSSLMEMPEAKVVLKRLPEKRKKVAVVPTIVVKSKKPKVKSKESEVKSKGPDVKSKEPGAKSKEPDLKSKETGNRSIETGAKSKEPVAKSKEPVAKSKETGAKSKETGAKSKEPKFEIKEPEVAVAVKTKEGHVKCSVCNQFLSNEAKIQEHIELHKSLTCEGCKRQFRSQKGLENHLYRFCKGYMYNQNLKCEHCFKYFKTKVDLAAHIEKDHDKSIEKERGEFPCSDCNFVFNFADNLKEHKQRKPYCTDITLVPAEKGEISAVKITFKDPKTGETKVRTIQELLDREHTGDIVCEICEKSFPNNHRYSRHIHHHSKSKHFTCNICYSEFGYEDNLKRHKKRHNAKPYYCENCFSRYSTKAERQHHVKLYCKEMSKVAGFPCKVCTFQAANEDSLKSHAKMHQGELLTCSVCNKRFSQKVTLARHWLVTHSDSKQKHDCPVCGKTFRIIENLRRHLRVHGEKRHKCQHCDYVGIDKRSVRVHMLTHSDNKDFICDFCGKAFRRKHLLDVHRRLHTGEKPFKCDVEGQFKAPRETKIEIKLKVNEEAYESMFHHEYLGSRQTGRGCEKAFRVKEVLTDHKKQCHSSTYSYMCDFCGKGFKVKSGLSHHRLYHIIDYRWPCQYCDVKCSKLKHYKAHIVKDHPEKIDEVEKQSTIVFYRCTFCPKLFSKKEHFDEHVNFHKGIKPFKCVHCGKGFCSKGNKRQHEKSHTGEKNLKCNLCSRTYSDLSYLKEHLKTKHSMVVSGDFIPREVQRIPKPRQATTVDHTAGQGDLVRREAMKRQLTKQGPVMGDIAHHNNVVEDEAEAVSTLTIILDQSDRQQDYLPMSESSQQDYVLVPISDSLDTTPPPLSYHPRPV